MLGGNLGVSRSQSLMNEYAQLLGSAVLRHRTHVAEHSARIEAELASKVKSEFIANMSHELRTPLNSIIGFSKLIAEAETRSVPIKDVVAYAGLIQDAADHLLAVINDILHISKIQSGRIALQMVEVEIDEVLTPCVSSLVPASEEAGVTLSCEIEPSLQTISGDLVKLRQVFLNLLSNAIKFTPHGGKVTASARKAGSGAIAISVVDTGVGMSAEDIAVALTPFGQVDGGKNRWREGTGLGLPIAQALIRLHSGELEISSEKGAGTTVSVILPTCVTPGER